jgi:hypothetical protein
MDLTFWHWSIRRHVELFRVIGDRDGVESVSAIRTSQRMLRIRKFEEEGARSPYRTGT